MLRFASARSPSTAPAPVFRAFCQARPQRAALHVLQHGQQPLVLLHRERLEPPLVEMPTADGFVMGVPAHRVRQRQPVEEFTGLLIGFRPNHELPVVGHHHVAQNPDSDALPSLQQRLLKGLVVVILLEQAHPPH